MKYRVTIELTEGPGPERIEKDFASEEEAISLAAQVAMDSCVLEGADCTTYFPPHRIGRVMVAPAVGRLSEWAERQRILPFCRGQ